ncbi:hypothetical protein [uncultured Methanoregula sp.]|uniref:hypothetical protein n=1 Tax=uncultured Methanoregula sp. TaxID=1005933 RepID=UPI002AABBB03|nr:hypothetical protein [uncultured Methanoregula sp.]
MKRVYLILACLCLLAFAVMPAQAFTAKSLTVTLAPNGDAQINMQYDLNFLEKSAVFFRMADPATEVKKAFASNTGREVTVNSVTDSSADIVVPSYAGVTRNNGATTLTTPAISFLRAQEVLKRYWFAPLVSANFAPQVTTITFPDGYQETFINSLSMPAVSHTMSV